MEYQRAIQAVNRGEVAPVYVLHGTEAFLRESFKAALLAQLGPEETWDITPIDLEVTPLTQGLAEANTYSFFAAKRVVVFSPAISWVSTGGVKLTPGEEKEVVAYLQAPNPDTLVIIETATDALDKRRKLVKSLQSQAVFVDVTPMPEKEVDRYVRHYLEGRALTLNRAALDELMIRVDYQLTLVMSELHKLEIYAKSGKNIDVHVVRQLVPRTLENDVFELTKAVTAKQIDQAIQIYQDLILMKNDPVALHALLVSQYRIMCQAKILQAEGYLEGQIGDYLGIHPYRVKLALQAGRSQSLSALLDFYRELAQVDYQMKTGQGIKETHFYLLLTKLAAMEG